MNEKVTLTVYKNSPLIWTGGLDGEELANWLIGRANAIRWLVSQRREAENYQQLLEGLHKTEPLKMAYASLGVSHNEQDPIPQLSGEAIQFDKAVAASELAHRRCVEGIAIHPLEFSLLPDLAAELEALHQKREALPAQDSNQFSKKEDE